MLQMVRKLTLLFLGAQIAAAASWLGGGTAHADAPATGCETVVWGFLASQRRTLCDGPIMPDGHWQRARVIWTPAHQVPLTCYGQYVVTCTGGYFVATSINKTEEYPVRPDNVLPDEPGHLDNGETVL